jgi:hypothetical protein
MRIKIGPKSFDLKYKEVEYTDQGHISSLLSKNGDSTEKIIYHSDSNLSDYIIRVGFYNACLRWSTSENIAKKLIYEFLVCITGETQLSRLLKKTQCTDETHYSGVKHYFFEIKVHEVAANTAYVSTADYNETPSLLRQPTFEERNKLAEIQLKLLSKMSSSPSFSKDTSSLLPKTK